MWIEKTPNGNYKYCERYLDFKTNKRKKVSITYTNKSRETQKNAQIALNEKIARLQNESKLTRSDVKFFEAFDEWMSIYEKRVEPATYESAKYFRKKADEYFDKDILIARMNDTDFNNFFDYLLFEQDLANSTVSQMKSRTNLLVRFCKKKGYLDKSSLNDIVVERKKDNLENIEEKFFEDDEYHAVIEACENKRYRMTYEWMYYTGMRIGEVQALRKQDVHLSEERNYADVSGTFCKFKKERKDRTKTKAGHRQVDLPPRAIEIYHEFCKLSKSEYIFVTSKSTPIEYENLNNTLYKIKRKLGIKKMMSNHTFRHTHISKLAELGIPLHVIKDRVGHENSKITEQIYLHVTQKLKDDMVSKLQKL